MVLVTTGNAVHHARNLSIHTRARLRPSSLKLDPTETVSPPDTEVARHTDTLSFGEGSRNSDTQIKRTDDIQASNFTTGKFPTMDAHPVLLDGLADFLQHRVLVAAFDDRERCVIFVGRDTLLVFGHHLQLHMGISKQTSIQMEMEKQRNIGNS